MAQAKGQILTEARLRAMLKGALEELRDQSIKSVPAGKLIWHYTDEELDAAIDRATKQYGPAFWVLLNGIDAYLERRRRHSKAVRARKRDWILNCT